MCNVTPTRWSHSQRQPAARSMLQWASPCRSRATFSNPDTRGQFPLLQIRLPGLLCQHAWNCWAPLCSIQHQPGLPTAELLPRGAGMKSGCCSDKVWTLSARHGHNGQYQGIKSILGNSFQGASIPDWCISSEVPQGSSPNMVLYSVLIIFIWLGISSQF